jgi:hypothetical protein
MKNKWLILAAFAALLGAPAAALTQPLLINFQGKLVNPTTNNPTTGTVGLVLSLYTVASGGTNIWTETQPSVTVTNGVFSVQIGAVTPLPRDIFLGPNLYLGVQVSGDAAGEMLPRQRLIMSPYSFTTNQVSDAGTVRLIADTVYSTFSNAGNFTVPGGLVGSSGSFVNGVNATSATFTQFVQASSLTVFGVSNTAYSLTVSSGLGLQQGTLDVNGGGGITNSYGLWSASATFTLASATWTIVSSSGMVINSGELQVGGSGSRVVYDNAAMASTAFSSNVIVNGNFDAANIDLVLIGSGTLTAAAASLTVSFPAIAFNSAAGNTVFYASVYVPGVSGANLLEFRFNGDAGANYATAYSVNSAGATTATGATSHNMGATTFNGGGYCYLRGSAVANIAKFINYTCARGSTSAAAPQMINAVGTYAPATPIALTSITVLTSAGTLNAGTTIRVSAMQ